MRLGSALVESLILACEEEITQFANDMWSAHSGARTLPTEGFV
jgi:hypothetical protein